ncbi:uncharacterized protein Z519_12214 [Cladophialophora bantiana CBS 173.52]|uniref:Alcohol dehydrogenase-like C-terminal domain-containing protein n=1 Tax=Cladophialophora bantiana (strain ATCC 10958 / CBS 173.52 / CDC B-1940 / NIH 8579) TaxID=1442370 RepID=A0A0D2H1H9_CLAB1|nr:uncharacterized protein Z519_12214 [Cladophialophora bantiana CBS 173.52]KIW87103.1 hypothetical protein Z519_12214 [Cladophialophora bantiana CBS 173.52]
MWIVFLGADGGLGHIVVQYVPKTTGMRMTGFDGGDNKAGLVKSLGADAFFDFSKGKDILAQAMELTTHGAHSVLCFAATKQTYASAPEYVYVGGAVIIVELLKDTTAVPGAPPIIFTAKRLKRVSPKDVEINVTGTPNDVEEASDFAVRGHWCIAYRLKEPSPTQQKQRPPGPQSHRRIVSSSTESMNSKKFDIINPATEKLAAIIYIADVDDVDIAVKVAKVAVTAWTESGALAPVGYLFRLADALNKHADELDYLDAICMGKPIGNFEQKHPLSVLVIGHLCQEIDLPKGMLNILSEIGRPCYEALAKDRVSRVQMSNQPPPDQMSRDVHKVIPNRAEQ